MTELELVSLCLKGDGHAQRELYTKYAARVNAVCLRYLGDPVEAEDLLQEIMIKVFDNIRSFEYKGDGSLMAWIKRLATNTAIDKLRKKGKLKIFSLVGKDDEDPAVEDEEMVEVPLDELRQMVVEIPDTQRVILSMFCFDGYSHKEIAGRLGITERASSSLLSKAKKTLAEKIQIYQKEHE